MANTLSKDKQIQAIAALAEGNSIRSIERMSGVHRDTIMRLGVRIGKGCARLLDQTDAESIFSANTGGRDMVLRGQA